MSRRLNWKVGVENKEEPKVNIIEKIKIARRKNEKIFRVVEEMKT